MFKSKKYNPAYGIEVVYHSNCKFSSNFQIRVLGFLFAILSVSSLHVNLAFAQSQNAAG